MSELDRFTVSVSSEGRATKEHGSPARRSNAAAGMVQVSQTRSLQQAAGAPRFLNQALFTATLAATRGDLPDGEVAGQSLALEDLINLIRSIDGVPDELSERSSPSR